MQFEVCAVNDVDHKPYKYPPEVKFQISQEIKESYIHAAKEINKDARNTIVIVQHEYGIFGGNWGNFLVNFLNELDCSILTTLHTVIVDPTDEIRRVTEKIIQHSDRLVTLTDTSHSLITKLYPQAKNKAERIMHGIHPLLYRQSIDKKPQFGLHDRSVMLTFGLLSRNKGIEYIISALPEVIKKVPDVMYLVVGGTHPGVQKEEGEAYRDELIRLVEDLSLQNHVKFVDGYLPLQDILDYLQATDIYVATSLDPNQAVSGTLSYALGAGRAVIATNFAQAKEIVNEQVGRFVPIRNSEAVSEAAIELFSKPDSLQTMNYAAYAQTRSMLWTNVADNYASSISSTAKELKMEMVRWPNIRWDHLISLSKGFGLLQFSKFSEPQKSSGYTLDDNCRALQLVSNALQGGFIAKSEYDKLSKKYLDVIEKCLSKNPPVNYLYESSKLPTKQNLKEDLSDSLSRAYYALQVASYSKSNTTALRAKEILEKYPIKLMSTKYIRSLAQQLLGASYSLQKGDDSQLAIVNELAGSLVESYNKYSSSKWRWFDKNMTYANGHLCSSMLEAGIATGSTEYCTVGLECLEFLCDTCFMGEVYAPIGQKGWYKKGGIRAIFDQQPEDTFSMIHALESAHKLTGDSKYVGLTQKVFSWYMGNNLIGKRLYDDVTGGCFDGLMVNGVNNNEGAESTISYLSSRLVIENFKTRT